MIMNNPDKLKQISVRLEESDRRALFRLSNLKGKNTTEILRCLIRDAIKEVEGDQDD